MGVSRPKTDAHKPNSKSETIVTANPFIRQIVEAPAALPVLVGLYLFVFLIPIEFSFYIGPLLMTPTRLFLMVVAVPVIATSLSKHRLQSEDAFFVFFIVWVSIAYFYKRGAGGID